MSKILHNERKIAKYKLEIRNITFCNHTGERWKKKSKKRDGSEIFHGKGLKCGFFKIFGAARKILFFAQRTQPYNSKPSKAETIQTLSDSDSVKRKVQKIFGTLLTFPLFCAIL